MFDRLRAIVGRSGQVATTAGVTYLGMGLSLLSTPMVAQELGASGKGILVASFVSVQMLGWIGFLGLPRILSVQANVSGRASRGGLVTLTALGGVNAILGIASADIVSGGDPRVALYVRVASILLLTSGISQYGLESALAAGRLKLWNLSRLGYAALPSLVFIVAYLLGGLTLQLAYLATLAGQLFSAFIGVCLAYAYRRTSVTLRTPWAQSLRYWTTTVFDSLSGRLDQLLLAALSSAAILGSYSIAVTLASASGSVAQAINSASFSKFVESEKSGATSTVRRSSALGVIASIAVGALLIPALALFGEPLLGPSFVGLVPTTAILVFAQILSDQWMLRVFADTASGRSKSLAIASVVSLIMTVGLTVIAESTGLLSGPVMAGILVISGAVRLVVRYLALRLNVG